MISKAILFPLALTPLQAWANNAKTYDYALGDHMVDYPIDSVEVLSSALDALGDRSFIKVRGPEGTEIALTFRRPSHTLQYIEHDWVDRTTSAFTALSLPETPEFQFGRTKITEIQKALGQSGFQYACRQTHTIPDGFLSFLSFVIRGRADAVYTFVFESSADLGERGLVDMTHSVPGAAVLVATIVFRPSYPKDCWCAERVPYNDYAKLPTARNERSLAHFLSRGRSPADKDPWEVMTKPALMITKHGAITWGDRIHIMPDPADCTKGEIMVWAHTIRDRELLALEGKVVDASFNLVDTEAVRAPIEATVKLSSALYTPIAGREWPPFAVGSFVFGPFDLKRLIEVENNPKLFGFSLEFGSDVAGLLDNFWSLDGLQKAGTEVIKLCEAMEP